MKTKNFLMSISALIGIVLVLVGVGQMNYDTMEGSWRAFLTMFAGLPFLGVFAVLAPSVMKEEE